MEYRHDQHGHDQSDRQRIIRAMADSGGTGVRHFVRSPVEEEEGSVIQPRKTYWWLVAREPQTGRTFLIFGSEESEEDARSKGLEMLCGLDFDIKPLPTRNQARASSLLKGYKLEKSHSLKDASRRLGHKISRLRRTG